MKILACFKHYLNTFLKNIMYLKGPSKLFKEIKTGIEIFVGQVVFFYCHGHGSKQSEYCFDQ